MYRFLKNCLKKLLPHCIYNLLQFWFGRGFEHDQNFRHAFLYTFSRMRIRADSGIKRIIAENWENVRSDLHPKDRRMRVLADENVQGLSTENISFLINDLAKKYSQNGVYLEVGTYKGYSLLSAALYNERTRCIGIDNFSLFGFFGEEEKVLGSNIEKFSQLTNIEFHNKDYREAIEDIFSQEPSLEVDIYYYDGEHDYENQTAGLKIMLPHLAKRCIILVDDINTRSVDEANRDFLREMHDFRSILKVRTRDNKQPDWWNGFEVMARGR